MRISKAYLTCAVVTVACGGSTTSNDAAGQPAGATAGKIEQGTGGIGGTSTGGASSGGSSGAGAATTGGTAGTLAATLCRTDADCTLWSDCCTCLARGPGESVPVCSVRCTQGLCEQKSITPSDVRCVAGRCVFNRSCVPRCKSLPPPCPANEIASVPDNGCWGVCIPISECSEVGSCDTCRSAGLACVQYQSELGMIAHCVSTPPECAQDPTCQCMGVCSDGFQCIGPNSTALTCQCPTC